MAIEMNEDWTTRFHGLSHLPATTRGDLRDRARVAELPEGTRIFGPGQAPSALLLLLDGAVRVQQTSEQGREIMLYRVQAGESCVLTTACLLAYEDYTAEGIAETDIRAALISRDDFEDLVARSAEFRRFVFAAYSRRITDLFTVIEEVAFRRVDIRLARHLLDIADGGEVKATHQSLASDLGTAREVISRTLQDFSRRSWVELARGNIRVVAPAALARLAHS